MSVLTESPRLRSPAAPAAGTRAASQEGSRPIDTVRELTGAVASGDTEAFARLYRAWFDFALAEARRCTGRDEQFCLDAVQNAMLRVINRLKPLDTEAALAAWLTTAVRNAAIDLLRKEQRLRRRHREQALHNAHPSVADAATLNDAAERMIWLREQLANAEPAAVRALDMRYRLGWTLARIASTLHLSPGAVDGRINRTIAQLRTAAQEDNHE